MRLKRIVSVAIFVLMFSSVSFSQINWSAKWIAAEPDRGPYVQPRERQDKLMTTEPPPLPVFRRDFKLNKPVKSAMLSVAGLGQYEVHLNGVDVTQTVMNEGWTIYTKTIPYDSYDVTSRLHPGANAFGVLLGNGMYNVEGSKNHYYKFTGSFGQPKLILQLDVVYADGSKERIVSDESWLNHSGPIIYSSIYGGESYDANALPSGWDQPGFDANDWRPALEVNSPGGKLRASQSVPLVIAEEYQPVKITHPKPNVSIYDLGKNMSGWPAISVQGPTESKVTLLAGELLDKEDNVTQLSTKAFPENAVLLNYTLQGTGAIEKWHPRFTYNSFRYVQVTTTPATTGGELPKILALTGQFIHAGVKTVGEFKSSNELFNQIHTLIDRAVLSNLASVVTDCPSREKLGWLEQTYLNASTLMLNYNVTGIYEKMSNDIADSQLSSGMVPTIAPEYVAFVDKSGKSTDFRDSPEWSSAIILSPWALYQLTGDKHILEEHYAEMKHYIEYLSSRAENHLVNYGLGDWYDMGPNPPGESQLTSKLLTGSGTYYADLTSLAQIAALLKHNEDAEFFTKQADQVKVAFNATLFHPETNQYDRGSQTSNALALALHLVPEGHEQAVLNNLVADIHQHNDHVTAGDIGFHYVVRALTDYNRPDVMAAMLSRTDSPSYGYQIAKGATTLTETWDALPNLSQNHFMLGHAEEWFYRGLAGLTFDASRKTDEVITFQPALLRTVNSAQASYDSYLGKISIAWTRSGQTANVSLVVPTGAQALLKLPATASWQQGDSQNTPIDNKAEADGLLHLHLTAGMYDFSSKSLPE